MRDLGMDLYGSLDGLSEQIEESLFLIVIGSMGCQRLCKYSGQTMKNDK